MTEPIEDGEDTQRIEKQRIERIEDDALIYAKNHYDEQHHRITARYSYIAGAMGQLKELASLREQLKKQQELVSLRESQQDVMATDTVKLMDQIEYQNKSTKESNDRIMRLEFELKQKEEVIRELIPIVEHSINFAVIALDDSEFGKYINQIKPSIEKAKSLTK